MPVGEQAEQDQLERLALADDRALDLVEDAVRLLLDVPSASSEATTRPSEAGSIPLA